MDFCQIFQSILDAMKKVLCHTDKYLLLNLILDHKLHQPEFDTLGIPAKRQITTQNGSKIEG